jgi:hypothetical protein
MKGWNYIRENLQTRLPIIQQQNPDASAETIRSINKIGDPTGDKATFTPWLVRMYSTGDLKTGQYGNIRDILTTFQKNVNRNILQGKNRDINSFKSVQDLKSTLHETAETFVNNVLPSNLSEYRVNVNPQTIINLLPADPTGTKAKYMPFILDNYISGKIDKERYEEDVPKIREALKHYDHMVKTGQLNADDILDWDVHDLFFYVEKKRGKQPLDAAVLKSLAQVQVDSAEIDGRNYSFYKISRNNMDLLVEVSQDTNWCVKKENTADYYYSGLYSDLNFFIVITSNNMPAYLVHYPTLQFKDSLDERVKNKQLARQLLSKLYPDNIMQPWNIILEANKEKMLKVPFFRMTYEAVLKNNIERFNNSGRSKREATPLIISNTINNYPMFAELYSDFTDILENEEKASFKDQCKMFIRQISDAELRSQIDILY